MVDLHNDENEKEGYLNNMPDADEAIMPESVLDNEVKQELVMQTINELSDKQRACILLFYLSPVEQATSLRYAYILGAGHLKLDVTNLQDLIFLFVHSLASGGKYDTLSLATSKDLPHLRMLDIDNDSLENLDMLYHTPALEFFEIGETDRIDDGISTIATL